MAPAGAVLQQAQTRLIVECAPFRALERALSAIYPKEPLSKHEF